MRTQQHMKEQENEEKRTLKHGGTVVVNNCVLIKRGGGFGKGKISKVATKRKFIIAGGLG